MPMTLHILSSTQSNKLSQMQGALAAQDALLLLGDGLYQWAFLNAAFVDGVVEGIELYARTKDAQQRGLNQDALTESLHNKLNWLDDEQWVSLTLAHSSVIHWHD